MAAQATLNKAKLGDSELKIAVYRASQRWLPTHLVDHPLLVSIKRSIGLVWGTR
jgi:hypothetical protein